MRNLGGKKFEKKENDPHQLGTGQNLFDNGTGKWEIKEAKKLLSHCGVGKKSSCPVVQ